MPEHDNTEYGRCRECQAPIVRFNRKQGWYHRSHPPIPYHYAIPSVVA